MEILISFIIPFIILLTVVVFIHEYGHYYYAKKYGVGVTDFSIGFGKEIFGFNDKSGTRWKFCAIPLGGYVKFFGDRNVFSQAEQEELLKKYNKEDQEKLFIFVQLIIKWNKIHNLTAITETKEIVSKHLLDSLSVSRYLYGQSIIDVGTGAGLPGIPLAVANPDKAFTLLDSSKKKIAFINEAKRKLALTNVTAEHCRVEQYSGQKFSSICSRAYSSLEQMVTQTEHLIDDKGVWLAMKGVYPQLEVEGLSNIFQVKKTIPLAVPGLAAERHLLIIKKKLIS